MEGLSEAVVGVMSDRAVFGGDHSRAHLIRQVNRQTGHRVRHQMVDSVTGEVVQAADKARGYGIGEQKHLLVDDRELEAARQQARARPFDEPRGPAEIEPVESKPVKRGKQSVELSSPEAQDAPSIQPEPVPVRVENTRTIEIERFVSRDQLDARSWT